jgi:hypothetical protein
MKKLQHHAAKRSGNNWKEEFVARSKKSFVAATKHAALPHRNQAASTAGRDRVGHLRLRAQVYFGQIAPRYTYINFSTKFLAHPHSDHPSIPYRYLYLYGTQVPSRNGRPTSSAATIPRRPIGSSHMAKRLEAKHTLDACSRRCSSIRAPPPPGRTDGRLVDLSNDSLGAVAVVGHAHH